MAKQTGIKSNFYLDSSDLSGDVGAIDSINKARAQLDVTSIASDFMERLPGIEDASMGFTAFYNNTGAHAQLRAMGTAATVATVSLGVAVGASAASMVGAKVSFTNTRGQDGSLVQQAQILPTISGGGLEWGNLLTAGTVSATGTASSTLDNAASTSTGGAAYLHVFSVTAGTVTVAVQDSADNSSFSNVTGLSFTAASAGTAQRVETAGTASIGRYTRINVSGGTAVLAVNFVRGL